jgi:hypothetical protein
MKRGKNVLPGGWACLVLAGLMILTGGAVAGQAAAAEKSILVGNGHSESTDPQKAGAEAAAKAKAALGDQAAKLVLVFDSVGKGAEGKQQMLAGVTSVFDPSIVYGCSAYAPLTQDSNTGTVGVLAVGGAVRAVPAVAEVKGDHEACGKRIGQSLKAAGALQSAGRLVLLFGACHVPTNDALVRGVSSVLGEKFPVAGGAAKGDLLYHKGKVVLDSNLGLLLTGDFKCSFSAKGARGEKKERVIAVAGEAAEEAVGRRKDRAALVLVMDCGGRRGDMGGQVDKELQAIRKAVGSAPMFGFYGSGETGPKDNNSPPRGVGHHVIICAIFSP